MSLKNEIKLKKRVALISLSIGVVMFLAKTGAFLITGSAAIFSDAAESVVHVLATSMVFYSIILSSKPADRSHLYGHGNIEYFSVGVEGILIVFAAAFIIYTAAIDIIYGSVLKQLSIGVIIISFAGIINLLLGNYLIRMGGKTNSITLTADGKHVLTDSYTSIGVIIGVILVMITDFQLFDPLFAIAVAVNILFTGYKLVRGSIGNLMNETDKKLLKLMTDELISMKKNYWIDIHWLRFWKSGDKVFIDFHLILPYYFTIHQAHLEDEEIENALLKIIPNSQVKIHTDYCNPELCKICDYDICSVRVHQQTSSVQWDLDKIIGEPLFKNFHIS